MKILGVQEEWNLLVFVVVYLSFFLDNVLLTVVVPIIPDYLFSNDLQLNSTRYNGTNYLITSLSPLQRKYEILESDNGPLGALLASKAFVQLAFTPFIGYIVGILGCYLPLLVGSCNMLLAALLFAYGNSYGTLVFARALHGSSSAAIAVSGMCILANIVPVHLRSRLMPLAFGGIALGVLIGYPLGGAAYQLVGKSAPFLLVAFFILISIALQCHYLRSSTYETTPDHPKSSSNHWKTLLKDYKILIIALAVCASTASMAILEPCVPMWLLARINPRPSRWQLGAVFIPDSIGYFLGAHFTGFLPMETWRIALCGMILVGLSCCGLPMATSISHLALPHFGIGLGVGVIDAALVPLLANMVDTKVPGSDHYGPVYALQQISVSLAYFIGPLLGGEAVKWFGFSWLIRIVGLLNIALCPLLSYLEKNDEEDIKDEKCTIRDSSLPSYCSLDNTNSADETE